MNDNWDDLILDLIAVWLALLFLLWVYAMASLAVPS